MVEDFKVNHSLGRAEPTGAYEMPVATRLKAYDAICHMHVYQVSWHYFK